MSTRLDSTQGTVTSQRPLGVLGARPGAIQDCADELDAIIDLSHAAIGCIASGALDDALLLGEKRDQSIRHAFGAYPTEVLQQFPRRLEELRGLDRRLMQALALKRSELEKEAQAVRARRAATRAYADTR
ncbi:MAG: hypothetical protein KDK91_06850 [Gammaproteobacteria bacterium]|nr:hypothetical protein [Gammaproteobacteria bacterium]